MKEISEAIKQRAYNFATIHQKFNLQNPQRYQDKIGWIKVYDYNDLKTQAADKILIHDFCKERLGKDICVPILKIFENPDQINYNLLPNQFVLKCNHGSGYNIIVSDKTSFNLENTKQKLKLWLNDDFSLRFGELHYHNIERKCYLEQYMNIGTEYQFLCFNGIPQFCQVINNRFDKSKQSNNFYDMNFKFVDICNIYFPNNPNIIDIKPKEFDEMRRLATIFAKDFKLVRVDFYLIDGIIYLGEMTFTPGNGHIKFKNPEHDYILGNLIKLD